MEEKSIKPIKVNNPLLTKGNIVRSLGAIVGLTFAGIGVLFMISIIMFIPGIFAVLVGMVIAVLSAPKASVECPSCGTENKVTIRKKGFTCEGCSTVTPIEWIENKWTSFKAWKK